MSASARPLNSVGLLHGTAIGFWSLALLFLTSILAEANVRDSAVDALRAWWIDPGIATLSFAFAIMVYDREERKLGSKSREFLSAGSVTTLFFAGVAYWVGVGLWVCTVPPPGLHGTGIPDGAPATLREVVYLGLEVAAGVVAYDLLFFSIHLSMHSGVAALWSAHKTHHSRTGDLRARDVLLHSPVDGALQVLVNIFVQRHTPWGSVKSRCARAIHNVIVTWMLTESHAACPTPRLARRWFAGVQRHRAHHTNSAQYFQPFFGYLDDLRLFLISS